MLKLARHRGPVRAVAYSPGPVPLLASAGEGCKVRLWDPFTGKAKGVLTGKASVRSLAFSADGSKLAAGGAMACYLSCWDLPGQTRLDAYCRTGGATTCLAFSADGRCLLIGARTRSVATWTVGGQLLRWEVPLCLETEDTGWVGDIDCAAFAPARGVFAIGRLDHTVEVWEPAGRRTSTLGTMPQRARAVQFSPGQADLLAVATGKEVWVWDFHERGWQPPYSGHLGGVVALAFSPDGRRLLSSCGDHSVRLWDVASGRQLDVWDWGLGAVHAVAFAPDGMTAACGGDRPPLVVWDIDEG